MIPPLEKGRTPLAHQSAAFPFLGVAGDFTPGVNRHILFGPGPAFLLCFAEDPGQDVAVAHDGDDPHLRLIIECPRYGCNQDAPSPSLTTS